MNRSDVYAAIDSEREYQEKFIVDPNRPDMRKEMEMGSLILAIEECLSRARNVWYSDAEPYPKTMEHIRKVAGLAVQAGERFGMAERLNAE